MVKWVKVCLTLAGFTAAVSCWGSPPQAVYLKWDRPLHPQFESGRWITESPRLDGVLARYNLVQVSRVIPGRKDLDPYGLKRVLRLDLRNIQDCGGLIQELRSLPETQYAVENPVRNTDQWPEKYSPPQVCEVPNDPLYPQQWFYPVISAPPAWDVSKGNGVVVAVVDNGTDWNHPDLADNIWHNPGEIPNNGIDDDGNGYIDDTMGWDFYNNDNNPQPEYYVDGYDYHGTHTAGLVAAIMNNSRGVVGMAPQCKLMAVRTGYGSTISYGLQGIIYAANNGADIISLSWGGSNSNSFEQDVINDAGVQGCLVIAAAGNGQPPSPTPHYPAAYDGVIAVAATGPNDQVASYSNYGSWIRVCAPGSAILSLGYQTYVLASGTSMSTPLTAGLAALIKSFHPLWSPQQIYSQILYTADPIDGLNPGYQGLLGSGRIDAYRAITETAPGLRIANLISVELTGNMNGRLEPGETAALILSLTNEGAATGDIQVALSSSSTSLQVLQGNWTISLLDFGITENNSGNPYRILVNSNAGHNLPAALNFALTAENFYHANLNSSIWIDPNFADHDTGNVAFTVTDFGAFGYRNYLHPDPQPGSGFRLPKNGSNALYHGSFMAGLSTTRVSDCANGDYFSPRYDWENVNYSGILVQPDTVGDQIGVTIYQDTGAPSVNQCSLRVTQKSYAWANPPDDDYVIVSFTLKNVSNSTMTNLYAGMYMDWDVAAYNENQAGWDVANQLGYQYNASALSPNHRYYGLSLISGSVSSFKAVDITHDLPPAGWMTDSMKYAYMSSGTIQTPGNTPSDYALLMSAGPYVLPSGDSVNVAFSALGGEDLNDLKANTTAAQARWENLTNVSHSGAVVHGFRITGAYPQPANGDVFISFTLPGPGRVSFDLVDVLGRVTPLLQQYFSPAGVHHIRLSRAELASGMYLLRATSPYGRYITKIVWIK